MVNNQEFLAKFESYLFLQKRVALRTFIAYKKDIKELLQFLADNEKLINEQDIVNYINFLGTQQLSLASVKRKMSSLKLFLRFLHEKYQVPDLSNLVKIKSTFVIFSKDVDILQIINNQKNKNLNFTQHRTLLILYLLYATKVRINEIIKLKISDIDFEKQELRILKKNTEKYKRVILPLDLLQMLKAYIKQIPYNTLYLFPVMLGNLIVPISRQAVLAQILNFAKKFKNKEVPLITNNFIDKELIEQYKKNHPRY